MGNSGDREPAVGDIAMGNKQSFLAEVLSSGRRGTTHEVVTFVTRKTEAHEGTPERSNKDMRHITHRERWKNLGSFASPSA